MDWAYILVILLAVLFAVFLIVAIALIVVILRISKQIKSAAASAERTVTALEGSVNAFHKSTLPLMAAKGIIGQVMRRSKSKKDKRSRE